MNEGSYSRRSIMEFRYGAGIVSHPLLHEQAQIAAAYLESTFPYPLETATVEWDVIQDTRGRQVVTLAVRDPLGDDERITHFTPADLGSVDLVYRQFRDVVSGVLSP